jgi:hypothetical protein
MCFHTIDACAPMSQNGFPVDMWSCLVDSQVMFLLKWLLILKVVLNIKVLICFWNVVVTSLNITCLN